MDYIEIDKDLIPYRFDIELADEEYEIEVNHNERFDFFTIDLYRNGIPLIVGEKMMLNKPLFDGIANIELPKVKITPEDRAESESRITFENLESTVFLYVSDLE